MIEIQLPRHWRYQIRNVSLPLLWGIRILKDPEAIALMWKYGHERNSY